MNLRSEYSRLEG
jgi:regulator of replication initiation timing